MRQERVVFRTGVRVGSPKIFNLVGCEAEENTADGSFDVPCLPWDWVAWRGDVDAWRWDCAGQHGGGGVLRGRVPVVVVHGEDVDSVAFEGAGVDEGGVEYGFLGWEVSGSRGPGVGECGEGYGICEGVEDLDADGDCVVGEGGYLDLDWREVEDGCEVVEGKRGGREEGESGEVGRIPRVLIWWEEGGEVVVAGGGDELYSWVGLSAVGDL